MSSEHKKQRNCGVDCLRIVAMFAIVLQHCILHSGILQEQNIFSVKYGLVDLVTFFCFGAVNTYLLISGYINVNTKYKLSRIMYLWIEVIFYNLIINIVATLILKTPVTADIILRIFTPLLHHEYWFFTRYALLFLLMPIINMIAHKMSKKCYRIFLIVIYVLFCFVAPVVKKYTGIDIFILKGGYSTVWFVAMYMTGAYFRLHFILEKKKKIVYFLGFVFFSLLLYLDNEFIPTFFKQYKNVEISSILSADTYSSPFTVLAVVCMLLLFVNIDFSNRIKHFVCSVGPLTFGVYLIHDNPITREYVVSRVPKMFEQNFGNSLVIWMVLCAVFFFFTCLLIEFLVQLLFKKIEVRQVCNKICLFFAKIFKKVPPIYNLYFADLVDSCNSEKYATKST